jgi:hypothetical protein
MKRVRINIAAIYAARSHRIQGALPAERSREFCATECYARGDTTICDASTVCWAKSVGADGRVPILAQRRLQLERGRTPAPRPRSIAVVARDYYTNQGGPR